MLRPLSCLLLLITTIHGIDVIPQPDHFKSDRPLSHPEEILPAEVWESILDYLPVTGQATLAAVHPFFRDDFFWGRRFRISFPDLPLPTPNIKSLCRYVLVTQAIDTRFRDPMAITLRPETYNWILEATFIDPVADQLKEYVAKIYEARQSLEERAQTIKMLANSDPQLSRSEFYRWYHRAFTAAEGGDCNEQITSFEGILIEIDRYVTPQSIYSRSDIKDYLEYLASIGDIFAQRVLANAMISSPSVYSSTVTRAYLKEYPVIGNQIAQDFVNKGEGTELIDLLSEAEIKEYLIDRSYKGDQQAHDLLNKAALIGRLGFTSETGRAYLEEFCQKGDQNAQQSLNYAALSGRLGFTSETGRAYLEKRCLKEDLYAQKMLNEAALEGKLGFTSETGRAYLEKRSQKEDRHAQYRLDEAAVAGKLGFTSETGGDYLEERSQKGDDHAQWHLRVAIIKGTPGFTTETRCDYLETQANNGDDWAEDVLSDAAFYSKWGFTEYTGRQYLEMKAAQGRRLAQAKLHWAACKGSHGFTEESGKDYLLEQIKKGDGPALLHFYLIKTIRENYYVTRLHWYGNCGQQNDQFLILIDVGDAFQKIKTKETADQIAFAEFMLQFEPIHAIPVRWFFSFFNTLLGRN